METADLSALIEITSRTFALASSRLDEPLATDVRVAFLLDRIAKVLESAPAWTRTKRMAALDAYSEWLTTGGDVVWIARALGDAPSRGERAVRERQLVGAAPELRAMLLAQGEAVASAVTNDVCRAVTRMASFVERETESGALVLRDLMDLRDHAYATRGIMMELLTDLAVRREPSLEPARDALFDLAPSFGEGLELVRLLEHVPRHAREGRMYLPPLMPREKVLELARAALDQGDEYVELLDAQSASFGLVLACELPRRLAAASLDHLESGAAVPLSPDAPQRIATELARLRGA